LHVCEGHEVAGLNGGVHGSGGDLGRTGEEGQDGEGEGLKHGGGGRRRGWGEEWRETVWGRKQEAEEHQSQVMKAAQSALGEKGKRTTGETGSSELFS
jgi:hypothetical protein